MKKPLLLTLLAGSFIALCSYSGGTAISGGGNCTGSYGSQNSCTGSNCHAGNTTDAVVDIILEDMYGNVVTGARYFPNVYYKVKIKGYITNGTFPSYSYQFSASSQTGTNVGTFVPTSGLHTTTVGTAFIVEPDNEMPTSGAANQYADSFLWRSPSAGAGQWTLFATVLGANGDNGPQNDKANNYQRSFNPVPASVSELDAAIRTQVYPNPLKDRLHISLADAPAGNYQFTVFNMLGKVMYRQEHSVNNSLELNIPVTNWAAGGYYLEIGFEGRKRTLQVLKL